jgi:XTP/dITP diphosphohydrolase
MTQQEQPGLNETALPKLVRPLADPLAHPELDQLIAVLEQLRAPGGCAWDAEQTHESLVRYLVEETYELIDAIESGNREELIEELGDVLYQVIFHSDIAAHTPGEGFTLEDVAAHMTAKMVGRHPHVYGELAATLADDTAADVNVRWDEIKKIEKPTRTSVLDGVPQGMPALALADKLLGKADKLGMPAPLAVDVGADGAETEDVLGDQLLAIVAAARARGLDPERALRASIRTLQDDMRTAESR